MTDFFGVTELFEWCASKLASLRKQRDHYLVELANWTGEFFEFPTGENNNSIQIVSLKF